MDLTDYVLRELELWGVEQQHQNVQLVSQARFPCDPDSLNKIVGKAI